MAGWIRASRTADGLADLGIRAGSRRRRRWSPSGLLGLVLLGALVMVAVLADVIAPGNPFALAGAALQAPSATFPMGTDDLGRDLFTGVIHGTRTSLLIAGGVGVIVLTVGIGVGLTAGFRGGLADDLLMRGIELFQVIPSFFMAIVVIALFGPGLDRLVIVLGLTTWPILARIVRGQVLSLREREFVEAVRAVGVPELRIAWRHILPNVLPAALVILGLVMGQVLLIEASLGFLGLGDPNLISWGYLAGQAQRFLRVAWWLSLFPGLALVLAVLAFNLVSDGLNDLLDARAAR